MHLELAILFLYLSGVILVIMYVKSEDDLSMWWLGPIWPSIPLIFAFLIYVKKPLAKYVERKRTERAKRAVRGQKLASDLGIGDDEDE